MVRIHRQQIIQSVVTNFCRDEPLRVPDVPSLVVYIDVDYSLDTRQVYQQFATACIAKAKIIPILNAVLARQDPQSSADWPSWVPDWRKPPSAAFKPLWDAFVYYKQITPDVIALVRRGEEENFEPLYYLEVAEISPAPNGAAEFENYLRRLCRTWRPGILEDILGKLLPGESDAELELLCTNSTNDTEFDASMSHLLSLARSAMHNRCLFTAYTSPRHKYYRINNNAMECGDLILFLDELYTPRHAFKKLPQVMHLRQMSTHSNIEGEGVMTTTYRIIGSAYVTSRFGDRIYPPPTTEMCQTVHIQ